MFYFYLVVLVIWYTINNVWYVSLSREYDGISLSMYRSIVISIILSPLLFFVPDWIFSLEILLWFLLIWFMWGIWIVFQLESYKYLPAWIVASLMNLNVIWVIILWFLFYWEKLSNIWYIWWTIVLFCSVVLWFFKNDFSHLKSNYFLWLFLLFLRILTLSFWVFWVSYFGREADVYLSTFLWESMVIVTLLFLTLYNKKKYNYYIKKFNLKELRYLFLISIFPALGTLAIVKAMHIWSIPIVSITMASISILTAIVSYFLFKEKLLKIQWWLIILTLLWLVLMNI